MSERADLTPDKGLNGHSQPITNPVVKNLGNQTSMRTAINAMCAYCMGCTKDNREPGFIQNVRECTSYDCPLHHFRPHQPRIQ